MKTLCLAAALLLSSFAFSSASAAPVSAAGLHAGSPLVLARAHKTYRPSHRYHYVPGHRYRRAPHGWHRFARRPGDWRTRGCILVGPIWFCP